MRDDARDLNAPERSALSAGWPTTVGPVLLTLGLGNLLRGGTAAIVGCVFLAAGLVVTVLSVRSQRRRARSSGTDSPYLGRRRLVLLGLTVVVGALVYAGLLTLMDRG